MKKLVRSVTRMCVVGALVSIIPFYGCGDDSDKDVAVTSIKVDVSELILDPAQTGKIEATVVPENATNKRLLWSSKEETIATVGSDGTVTGVAPGNTDIVVSSISNPEVSQKITVTVNELDLALLVAGDYKGNVLMNATVAATDVTFPITRSGLNKVAFVANATIMTIPMVITCTATVEKDGTGYKLTDGTGITNDYGYGAKVVTIDSGTISADGSIALEMHIVSISEDVYFNGKKVE